MGVPFSIMDEGLLPIWEIKQKGLGRVSCSGHTGCCSPPAGLYYDAIFLSVIYRLLLSTWRDFSMERVWLALGGKQSPPPACTQILSMLTCLIFVQRHLFQTRKCCHLSSPRRCLPLPRFWVSCLSCYFFSLRVSLKSHELASDTAFFLK